MKNRHIRSFTIYLLVIMMISAMLINVAADTDSNDVLPDSSAGTDQAVLPDPSPEAGAESQPENSETTPADTKKDIVSIDIKTFGKNTYLEGEYFDPSNYVLKVTYADGSVEEVGSDKFKYSPTARLVTDGTSNDVNIEFTYKGKIKKIYVTVKHPVALSVTEKPAKMQYKEGEAFDPAGLVLSLEYADGSRRQPSEDEYTIDVPAALTPDAKSATVSCYGRTVTLEGITVVKMTAMTIIKKPDKLVYFEGEKFDPAGMIVMATYENDSENIPLEYGDYTVTGPVDCLVPDSSDRRLLTLTLSVGEISQKLDLTVYGFESFVVTPPDKADYYYGDRFSADGLVVKAKYVNGEERDITGDVEVIAPEIMEAGSEVRIKYLGYDQTIISVHEVRSLHISETPQSLTFREGTLLTDGNALAEMLVTVEYDDGTELPLRDSEYTVSPDKPLTVDDTKITVSYRGLTASVDITVVPARAVESIKVTKEPELTEYISNQAVDVTGMEVTVYYEDGTSEVLPLDKLEITPAPGSKVKVTDTRLKIVYAVSEKLLYTTYQNIEVLPKKVVSLSILTPPAKIQYFEGEKFNTAGMEVLAVYNDGTSAKITTYTFSPSEPLTLSSDSAEQTVAITISYVDCTVIQNITLKERQVSSIEVAQNPVKLEYAPGERFDPTGLILKVNYADGTTALVENSETAIEFLPNGPLTENTTSVILGYRSKTLTLPITVRKPVDTGSEITTGTTPESDITTEPDTPGTDNVPVSGDHSSEVPSDNPNPGNKTIIVIWVSIIAVIIILLVVLIVYYKRNFT